MSDTLPKSSEELAFTLVHQTGTSNLPQTASEQQLLLEVVMHNVGQYAYVIERDEHGKGTFRPVFGDFEKLFGYPLSLSNDIDFWFDKIIHPEDKPRFFEAQKQLVPDTFVLHEYRYLHKDGHVIWGRIISRTVLRPTGGTLRYGMFQDITPFREAEQIQAENERLEKALAHEKELSATRAYFINSVMHEFRNPLASILLTSEILERYKEKLNDDEKTTRLHMIRSQILQLRSTLDDMSLIMNDEISRMGFNPKPQDIDAYLREILDQFHNGMGLHHHIMVTNELSDKQVMIDIRLLKYIIPTLLNNAAQYSQENTAICFRVYKQNNKLVFSVQDEGIGIPIQDQPYIFNPLFRGSNVSPTQHGGGLGLTIAKQCVDLHEGKIEFESKQREGSIFRVIVPYICG